MSAISDDVAELIARMERATEANFCTMGRAGSTVVLDRSLADEVMITGDLHGHRENFERILRTADLAHHPGRHLVLQEVCHGGPVYPQDGGCMSHLLLEEIARLVIEYPDRIHFLLGNHELAELSDYPIQKNRRMLNLVFRIGMQHRYGSHATKVRESYCPFLRSCPLAIRLPGGVFLSHSIPERTDQRGFDAALFKRSLKKAEYQRHEGPLFDMVWGRDYRPENARAFAQAVDAKVLINGHEPCETGYFVPNEYQIIIDCCGDNACYVIVPTDREYTQAEIVGKIRRLE
jgi:hypothetical protein